MKGKDFIKSFLYSLPTYALKYAYISTTYILLFLILMSALTTQNFTHFLNYFLNKGYLHARISEDGIKNQRLTPPFLNPFISSLAS
jgi:hypothetical protein